MRVWVTRDKVDEGGSTCMWTGEPGSSDDKVYYDCIDDVDLIVCESPRSFREYFGFTPRKGSCKQYELSLKEIE